MHMELERLIKMGATPITDLCGNCKHLKGDGRNNVYLCHNHPLTSKDGIRRWECIILHYNISCWAYSYRGLRSRLSGNAVSSILNYSDQPMAKLVSSCLDQINARFKGAIPMCPCECSI